MYELLSYILNRCVILCPSFVHKYAYRTRATNVDNITINGQFTLEEVSVLSDLSPANYYESQILSALKNWKGERLASYLQPREGDYINLYQMRDEFNEEQTAKSFFSPIKSK